MSSATPKPFNVVYDAIANALQYEFPSGYVTVPSSGGGTPGGANTQVQFNNMGAFGGSPDLTWDGSILSTPQINTAQVNYDSGSLAITTPAGDINLQAGGLSGVSVTVDSGSPALQVSNGFFLGTNDTYLQLNSAVVNDKIELQPDRGNILIHTVDANPGIEITDGTNDAVIQIGGNNRQLLLQSEFGIEILPAAGTGLFIQSGAAEGIADASATVQIDSTTQGFLPPRMTSTQRDAVSTPAEGLTIYNTTTHTLNFWNGSAWTAV